MTIISGIGPGNQGVSRLIEFYLEYNSSEVICPSHSISMRQELDKGMFSALKAILLYVWRQSLFTLKALLFLAKGRNEVTLVHHHSIGLIVSAIAIIRSKRVNFFCVDTSFFCIKSYNLYHGKECTRCVHGYDPHSECTPFPSKSPKFLHGAFLRCLVRSQSKLTYLCQTDAHAILVRRLYPEAKTRIVGLMTSDIKLEIQKMGTQIDTRERTTTSQVIVDDYFVFHGSAHPAKGFYALCGIPEFSECRILFPFNLNEVRFDSLPQGFIIPEIWEFKPMRWESGLRHQCIYARAVICPSVWSAPIEGALIKSMCVNNNIIVLGGRYSYQMQLDDHLVHNLAKLGARETLRKILNQTEVDALHRRRAIDEYISSISKNDNVKSIADEHGIGK